MLGDFGEEMEQTSSRMDSVLKKLEKVSHMTSSEWTTRLSNLSGSLKQSCDLSSPLTHFLNPP